MAITKLLLAAKAVIADPSYSANQVGELSMNADGRLRVSTKPGYFPDVAGNLITVGQQVAVDVTDASNVVVHLKNTGTATMSAGVITFEGSLDSTNGTDGTWFGVTASRSNANTVELVSPALSMAVGAGYVTAWEASVNAYHWFRVRLSTAVTASSIATVTLVRGSYATEPAPAIQTHPVTGSGVFLVSPNTAVTAYSAISTASTNAAVIKASAGSLFEISLSSAVATAAYVKLYNKATAPVPGTDIPILTIAIPAATNEVLYEFGSMGKRFTLGIGIAITAAAAATDVAVSVAGIQVHATYL